MMLAFKNYQTLWNSALKKSWKLKKKKIQK